MKKLFTASLVFFFTQKSISQSWAPLGSNEQTATPIANTAASTFFTAVDGNGVLYMSYIDDAQGTANLGDFKVHIKKYLDNQWHFVGDGVSPSFPNSDYFPLAAFGNNVYVAYTEPFNAGSAAGKLSVKKLNNLPGWELVGQRGFSDSAATNEVLAVWGSKIYVAYSDAGADNKLTVKYYDTANGPQGWQTAGGAGFSAGPVNNINIVVNNSVPYVAYGDFNIGSVVVKKLAGANWVNVGVNNPADNQTSILPSLKFDDNSHAYLVYVDTLARAVLRFLNANNQWVVSGSYPVGTFTSNVDLLLAGNTPCIAFATHVQGSDIAQVNVKKYNSADNSWVDVGSQPVTASSATNIRVTLQSEGNNRLVLTYHDFNGGVYAKTFDAGGLLPVKLNSFTANIQNGACILQWVTVSEGNSKLFEVEHSTNGFDFVKIGEVVAGKGGTNGGKQYFFRHGTPKQGVNYYRLRQVDVDDKFTYSKIISLLMGNTQPLAYLFPNPVKDVLHIANITPGTTQIAISDIQGRIIRRLKGDGFSVDMPLQDIARGTYFVVIYGQASATMLRFTKQ